MSSVKAVLIYDTASAVSRKFIERANVIPLPVNKKKVYDKIKSSPYAIKTVPCILVFSPDGKIDKYEGVDGIRFMESALAMEEEKVAEEVPIAGNERFTPAPRLKDDPRPDPEEQRKGIPGFSDISEVGAPSLGTVVVTDKSIINEMRSQGPRR
jgi:hypothetical protein